MSRRRVSGVDLSGEFTDTCYWWGKTLMRCPTSKQQQLESNFIVPHHNEKETILIHDTLCCKFILPDVCFFFKFQLYGTKGRQTPQQVSTATERVEPNRPTHSRELQEETAAVLTWPVLFSSDSWRPTGVTSKEPPAVIIHRHH